jgi:hypothetical protein
MSPVEGRADIEHSLIGLGRELDLAAQFQGLCVET